MIKVTEPITFAEGFDEFLYTKNIEGCRPATIKHYKDSIHVFLLYHDENMRMGEITSFTVSNFFCQLQNRGLAEKTLCTYIRALRTVLYFFMDNGWTKPFKIKTPKVTRQIKHIYTDEELRALLQNPRAYRRQNGGHEVTFAEYRDWAFVNYIMGTGQRLSTVINIKIGDVDLQNGLVYLHHLKNRKQVVLPLTASLVSVLKEYLRVRGGDQNDYLFCTAFGKQASPSTMICSIRRYNQNRGVEKTSIHLLRHTFAVNWIRQSGDIVKLQHMLTHSDLKTTQIYLDLVYDDLAQNMEEVNPLEKLKKQSEKIPGAKF